MDFNNLNLDTMTEQEYKRTEQECKRAIAIDPDDMRARENLAYTSLQQKRYAEAEEEYNQILATDPDDLFAHEHLAYLYDKQSRFVESEQAYKNVLTLDPNDKTAQLGLASPAILIPLASAMRDTKSHRAKPDLSFR